jgi:hypothetical protein
MQNPVEFAGPKSEKLPKFGIVGMQIVPLPQETLQHGRIIWPVIKDIGGRQPEAF